MKVSLNRKAFSLIELLIVMAIIMTFLGLTLVNYSRTNSEFTFDKSVKQFVDVLSLAKKKASAGDTSYCGGDAASMATARPTFQGYIVSASGTTYRLQVVCSSGTRTLKTYTLPPGTDVINAPSVQFLPFDGTVDAAELFILRTNALNTTPCVTVAVSALSVITVGPRAACP